MTSALPQTAVLEITARCNHRCVFCCCPWEGGAPRPTSELSTAEWKRIVETVTEHGARHVVFSGGEAVLRSDVLSLIDHAERLGLHTGLITNGRAVDRDFLVELSTLKTVVSISVPGIRSFEEHTGVDNIDHVLGLFEAAKSLNMATIANVTVTKRNIGELYENIAYPLIHGASYVLLNRFLPGGRGLQTTELMLSVDEINMMLDIAEEVLVKAGHNGHIGTELPYCIMKKKPAEYARLQVACTCGAAKSFYVIDPEGYVKVCNHSPVRVCRYEEMDTLHQKTYWKKFVDRDYLPEMCKECEHVGICDGGCREAAHVYSGKVDGVDPALLANLR